MCNVRDATGMAGRALSRWRALPLKLRGKIRVCVFASCAEALRSKLIGSAGRIAQYHDKSSNFEQAGTVVQSPPPTLAENESRRAWKSSCVNLTELNDEDRHQSYLHFRPNAFGRRTDPFQCSVF
jgi:hypothetical protein